MVEWNVENVGLHLGVSTERKRGVVSAVRAWVRDHKVLSVVAGVAALAFGLWLVFGFFAVQTLFIDEEVAEANPFAAGPAPSGLAEDATTEEMADEMNAAMAEEGKLGDEVVEEAMDAEVVTLVQGDYGQPPHGSVSGDPGAVDAGANHREVILPRYVAHQGLTCPSPLTTYL